MLEEKLRQINEELPTRIYNVSGSCAGAGSGDFHYYRQVLVLTQVSFDSKRNLIHNSMLFLSQFGRSV